MSAPSRQNLTKRRLNFSRCQPLWAQPRLNSTCSGRSKGWAQAWVGPGGVRELQRIRCAPGRSPPAMRLGYVTAGGPLWGSSAESRPSRLKGPEFPRGSPPLIWPESASRNPDLDTPRHECQLTPQGRSLRYRAGWVQPSWRRTSSFGSAASRGAKVTMFVQGF